MALTNDKERKICAKYSVYGDNGKVSCHECPLAKGDFRWWDFRCKANSHYNRRKKEWEYDECSSVTIEKKILPKYFREVEHQTKTFELRKDEDDIQVGDILVLREWDGDYTGNFCHREVTYVLRDCPEYGLMPGFCIIGMQPFGWRLYEPKNVCNQFGDNAVNIGSVENLKIERCKVPDRRNSMG